MLDRIGAVEVLGHRVVCVVDPAAALQLVAAGQVAPVPNRHDTNPEHQYFRTMLGHHAMLIRQVEGAMCLVLADDDTLAPDDAQCLLEWIVQEIARG